MHDPIAKTGAWLTQMLKGDLNYYAVSGNSPSLWWDFNEVRWRWLKSRLEVMHELLPAAKVFALLINPDHPNAEAQTQEMQTAARALGLPIRLVQSP